MLTEKVRKVIQKEIIEDTTVPVEIPKEWAMFSPKGNKRISDLAQRLYNAIDNPDLSKGQKVDALFKFHREWYRMSRHKTYREASDTAVRECVGDFHDKMAAQIGFDGCELWEAFWSDKASKGC